MTHCGEIVDAVPHACCGADPSSIGLQVDTFGRALRGTLASRPHSYASPPVCHVGLDKRTLLTCVT